MAEIRHINQYLKRRGNRWHYRRLVPRAYGHIDMRGEIRTSLKTSSLEVARSRRDALAEADDLYWATLDTALSGDAERAVLDYKSAKKRAMGRGFLYTPTQELVRSGDIGDILARMVEVARHPKEEKQEAVALLGTVKPAAVPISKAFDIYCDQISVSALMGKSSSQQANWRKTKNRAVKNFIKLCGDMTMDEITRVHARQFYNWWADRLLPKKGKAGLNPNSGNKDLGNLRNLYQKYWEFEGEETRENPFRNLRFAKPTYKEIPSFPDAWVQDKIMDPQNLEGMNHDARMIVYAMIETGCRPSEIVNLMPENIKLDAPIPHIQIRARSNRELKTPSSHREIPLLGISLYAFQQSPDGFLRYKEKSTGLSALLMKMFRTRGLFPTPDHRIYSFRHAFEKRMLEANLDYGLRCLLMGHYNPRPSYGDGGSMDYRKTELAKITHPFNRADFE